MNKIIENITVPKSNILTLNMIIHINISGSVATILNNQNSSSLGNQCIILLFLASPHHKDSLLFAPFPDPTVHSIQDYGRLFIIQAIMILLSVFAFCK